MTKTHVPQQRAPLFEALSAHAAGQRARFHVPGHGGRFADLQRMLHDGSALDLTELPDLDDLHDPIGPIARAEELAAASIGATAAHFLVNGTTAGIEALLVAATRPGDQVLVSRDTHQSVISGLIISGARPIYMRPEVDAAVGRSLGVSARTVLDSLAARPAAAVCQLSWPTYHGIKQDLQPLAALATDARPTILVDEAHGAHDYFADPPHRGTAFAFGADGTALSLHKTGLAPTQAALVASQGARIAPERLRAALRLLQSSSPSYLLLAGLDLARRELALNGARLLQAAADRRARLTRAIDGLPGLSVWSPAAPGITADDPLRLTIDVTGLGLNGWEAAEYLTARGIDTEFADFCGVLAALPLLPDPEADRRLLQVLEALAREHRMRPRTALPAPAWAANSLRERTQILDPRDAFFAATDSVPLADAGGKVAAEIISPYPPGIPLLVPGEEIQREDCELLTAIASAGGRIHGLDDAGRIRIVR
jgi:arginine decarboxylase